MNTESRQLRGWKEIAGYLRVSERSAKRWEQSRGLPVRQMAGASRDVVFAFTDELNAWLSLSSERRWQQAFARFDAVEHELGTART